MFCRNTSQYSIFGHVTESHNKPYHTFYRLGLPAWCTRSMTFDLLHIGLWLLWSPLASTDFSLRSSTLALPESSTRRTLPGNSVPCPELLTAKHSVTVHQKKGLWLYKAQYPLLTGQFLLVSWGTRKNLKNSLREFGKYGKCMKM